MKGKTYSVKNIYELLKSRHFMNHVCHEINNKSHTLLECGVPGTFLRQNIKKKWWHMMVEEQTNAFPVEKSAFNPDEYLALFANRTDREQHDKPKLNDCSKPCWTENRRMYMDVLQLNKGWLPFSIVSSIQRFNLEDNRSYQDQTPGRDMFFSDLIRNLLVSQCYTPSSGVNRVFDFWLQRRLSWWKKYAKNPSKFSVSSSVENQEENNRDNSAGTSFNGNGQVISINYQFPWGSESVEVVQNYGDTLFKDLPETDEKSFVAKTSGGKKCIPFCIQCTMSLETAAVTFLIDAYHERTSLATKKSPRANPVLQLHPQLSPFQSALLVRSDTASPTNELLHVCSKLEHDMQKAGVSVFNASRHGATQDAHFRRNDQLGIPYTLILDEKTLLDGSIIVRCRDTEIMKPVHVSRAVEELRQNVMAILE